MKRLVSLLLALSLVLALTACGSKADGAADAAAGSPPRDSAPAEESAGDPVELIVFAAASMTETLTEIAELYKTAAPECHHHLQLRFLRQAAHPDQGGRRLRPVHLRRSHADERSWTAASSDDTEENPDGLDMIVDRQPHRPAGEQGHACRSRGQPQGHREL